MPRSLPLLLISLLACTSCGGRSPADLQRTIGYTQSVDAQGQVVLDLAAQNRLSMQKNAPFSYVYTPPTQESPDSGTPSEVAGTSETATIDTDDALPGGITAAPIAEVESTEDTSSITESDSTESISPLADADDNADTDPLAGRPKAPNFQLENLRGEQQNFTFPRPKILILAIADQGGSSEMENWIKPLYDRYTDRVDIQGVAELAAVPKFARGIARGIIDGMVEQPILLDWTGNVSQQFGAQKQTANVYVISTEGYILAQASGTAQLDKLKALARVVDEAL